MDTTSKPMIRAADELGDVAFVQPVASGFAIGGLAEENLVGFLLCDGQGAVVPRRRGAALTPSESALRMAAEPGRVATAVLPGAASASAALEPWASPGRASGSV